MNMLQKAYSNSKATAVVAAVSAAGAIAGVYQYSKQLGSMTKFCIEVQDGATQAATAFAGLIATCMQSLEQHTGLTAWQV
jgi:threonine dehydratase